MGQATVFQGSSGTSKAWAEGCRGSMILLSNQLNRSYYGVLFTYQQDNMLYDTFGHINIVDLYANI